MDGPFIVPVVLFISIPVTIVGTILARAWARRLQSLEGRHELSAELSARLDRMEQAMDAVAIEVERMAEGQRYVTRLLSERSGAALPAPPAQGLSERR